MQSMKNCNFSNIKKRFFLSFVGSRLHVRAQFDDFHRISMDPDALNET